MNRNDKAGEALNRCLTRRAESLEVTSSDTKRMRQLVHNRIEEESGMKKWSARKVMVAAAAICALTTVTAIAAGRVVYTSGSSSHNDQFAYSQLADMSGKVGISVKAPETFGNGYTFDYGVPVHNEAMDEDHNVIKSAESLHLSYKKEGMSDIGITIQGTDLYEGEESADKTFSHGDISLRYSRDQYRFVPPDYQITQEEQALVDAGELYVSYGSQEVEDRQVQNVVWKDNGVLYTLLTFDNSMTDEELVEMAREIIDNQ